MTFFNPTEPLVRRKQEHLDLQDLEGIWRLNWRIGSRELFQAAYTRVDQAFLLWGMITIIIFTTAQFCPLSWRSQAFIWSVLSIAGSIRMISLTGFWAKIEHLSWVVYTWAILMLMGVVITDLGIFLGLPSVLINLCPLWLGLSAAGYLLTGMGLRSRTLSFFGIIHTLSIFILPFFAPLQFLVTGIVMTSSLFLLAQLQWDMRPPIDSKWLSAEQKQFNQQQQYLRQLATSEI